MNKKEVAHNRYMDPKYMAGILTSVIVGLIMFASVMVPIVSNSQTTVGTPTTVTNAALYDLTYDYYTENTTIIIDSPSGSTSNTNTTITVGDTVFTPSNIGAEYLFYGSGWWALLQSASNTTNIALIRGTLEDATAISANLTFSAKHTITWDASAKTITINTYDYSDGTTTTTLDAVPSDFMMGPAENGKYTATRQNFGGNTDYQLEKRGFTMAAIDNNTWAATSANQAITVGGTSVNVYYAYSAAGAIAYAATAGYVATINVEKTGTPDLIAGTTDIYAGTGLKVILTLTNTSTEDSSTMEITPDVTFALKEANGHATAGSLFNMLGVLPIIVMIGIVLSVVAMAIRTRD